MVTPAMSISSVGRVQNAGPGDDAALGAVWVDRIGAHGTVALAQRGQGEAQRLLDAPGVVRGHLRLARVLVPRRLLIGHRAAPHADLDGHDTRERALFGEGRCREVGRAVATHLPDPEERLPTLG